MRHRSQTTIRLPGYAGSAFDTAAVIAYLDARNPAIADTFSAATSSAGGGFVERDLRDAMTEQAGFRVDMLTEEAAA